MKKRLTITLDEDVLNQVDSIIDKKTIRNRSHAIETLLTESLGVTVKKAVILAGGTKNKKCVSFRKINGRTLLDYQLDHLKKSGIRNITICAGRFTDEIREKFGGGKNLGLSLTYLEEDEPFGTAGVLVQARDLIGEQKVLVLHGDVLTDFDLSRFMRFHKEEGSVATIAVKPRLAERKFGKVMISGNKIVKFISEEGDKGISIVNAGVYILEPEIFEYLSDRLPIYFEKDIFPVLARKKCLSAYIFQGKWYEVSRYKDYLKAKKKWLESSGRG